MTRREVLAWLDTRRPAPPPALRAHLDAAVTDSDEWLPAHLAELGQAVLARVTGRPEGGRELALDLLAADAFVTYAFEAQAEADVRGLAALADRVAATGQEGGGNPGPAWAAAGFGSPRWPRPGRRPRRRPWGPRGRGGRPP